MSKKILFAATTAKGHLNVFHRPHMDQFRQWGWEVHALSNGDEPVLEADKTFAVSIGRRPFRLQNLKALVQIIRILKTEHYDLITCHTPMGGALVRIAAKIAHASPVLYMAHGFHFYCGAPRKNRWIYGTMERCLARWTDALITINQEDFEAAQAFRLRKEGKVYKIPGIGVDLHRFLTKSDDMQQHASAREALRKTWGMDSKTIVILHIGEMIHRKNQHTVLRAFGAMKDTEHKKVLLLCGRGEKEKQLQDLAFNLRLQGKVIFAGFRKDIEAMLQLADIFFFPSYQEGLPVAVIEAMAAGLPVVASDIRGNKDLIEQGQGGYLYTPEDVMEFAKALHYLAENPKERQAMGAYNQVKAEAYDLSQILEQLKPIYESMLGYEVAPKR